MLAKVRMRRELEEEKKAEEDDIDMSDENIKELLTSERLRRGVFRG